MIVPAPFRCQFCGVPSWVDPSDQTPPRDYCHPEDHGEDPHAEWSRYHYAERELPDGRYAAVHPLTFGRARLVVMEERGDVVYLDGW